MTNFLPSPFCRPLLDFAGSKLPGTTSLGGEEGPDAVPSPMGWPNNNGERSPSGRGKARYQDRGPLLQAEKPRIRLGCPSRSTFSQAPRKLLSCGFWQKRVRLSDLLEGGLTVLQEPTLTVLLVLPSLARARPTDNGH